VHPCSHFGRLGRVVSLPPELKVVDSEAKVRVLEVEFEDGAQAPWCPGPTWN
jgi:hypothetical protein